MTTPSEAGELIISAHADGLLRQFVFRDTDASGTTYVNLLGAMGPEVLSPQDTPTEVMPIWMGYVCSGLFDAQREGDAYTWAIRIAEQMMRATWPTIDWEVLKTRVLLDAVSQAGALSDMGENRDRVSLTSLYYQAREAVATQAGLAAAVALGEMVSKTVDGVALDACAAMTWACRSPLAPSPGLDTTMADIGVVSALSSVASATARGQTIESKSAAQASKLCDFLEELL